MQNEQPTRDTKKKKKVDEDAQVGESLALAYDPAKSMVRRKAVTAPLKPLEQSLQQTRSPMLLVVSALIILALIALGVVLSTGGGDEVNEFVPQDSAAGISCMVVADEDVNVRLGPSFDYQRGWILKAGESRPAQERYQEVWFRIPNGWLPIEGLTLTPMADCLRLPEPDDPQIFSDDIALPDAIMALQWQELLGEDFATDSNGWLGVEGVSQIDGSLVLSATGDEAIQTYPAQSPGFHPLADAYYSFNGQWLDGSGDAELLFEFRYSDSGFYQLGLSRQGKLALRLVNVDETVLLAEASPSNPDQFVVGVLANGTLFHIYLNGERVIALEDETLTTGTFSLGLRGAAAEASINRFVIRIPRES